MSVETRLEELLKLTAPKGNKGANWTGKVEMDNLAPEVVEFINKNQQVIIEIPDLTTVKTTSESAKTIPIFFQVIDDLLVGNNVFLVGEAGTGKTYLAEEIANAISRKHTTINCNQWTSPREVIGGETIEGYKEGKLVDAWENGKMLILDEMPKLDANTAGLLNEALAKTDAVGDKSFITTGEGRKVKKHPNFCVIATGNTTGKRTSSKYGGNNKQDASLLDRFSSSYYYLEFNRVIEKSLNCLTVFNICDKIRDILIEEETGDIITLRTMKQMNKIFILEMERELGNVPKVKGGKTLKDAIESYLSVLDEDVVSVVKEKVDLKAFYNSSLVLR